MPSRRSPARQGTGAVVIERLRELADRPLDRRVGRAVFILGLAVTVAVSLLVGFATVGGKDGSDPSAEMGADGGSTSSHPLTAPRIATPEPVTRPEQDPQDRRGSAARRRAVAELESHRALQHVPYRRGGVAISLVGARGLRAVLGVTAPTIAAARVGWRDFLRRFHDRGSAYLARFRGGGDRG